MSTTTITLDPLAAEIAIGNFGPIDAQAQREGNAIATLLGMVPRRRRLSDSRPMYIAKRFGQRSGFPSERR